MIRSINHKTLWKKLFWTLDDSRNWSSISESLLPAIVTKVTLLFLPTSELLMLTLHSKPFKSMFLVSGFSSSFNSCSTLETTWFEHNHLRSFTFPPKQILNVTLKSSPHTHYFFSVISICGHLVSWHPHSLFSALNLFVANLIFHHFIQKYISKYFIKGIFFKNNNNYYT